MLEAISQVILFPHGSSLLCCLLLLIHYLVYFILFVLQLYHSYFCMYFEVELVRKLL